MDSFDWHESGLTTGLTIAQIRVALAELPEGQIPTRADWERIAERLRAELRERVDQLTQLLQELSAQGPQLSSA